MDKVKLDIRSKGDADLLQFTEEHITAMTGNANFLTPNPPPADFLLVKNAFSDALTEANMAQETAKQKTALKEQARAALEGALNSRASYVDSTAGGDKVKILSANLQVRASTAVPIGEMTSPIDFLATMGDMEGEMDLVWTRVRGARSYIIEVSLATGPRAWSQAAVVTSSKASINGLISGTKYAFRVRAVGAAGPGPWSDESVQMAP